MKTIKDIRTADDFVTGQWVLWTEGLIRRLSRLTIRPATRIAVDYTPTTTRIEVRHGR